MLNMILAMLFISFLILDGGDDNNNNDYDGNENCLRSGSFRKDCNVTSKCIRSTFFVCSDSTNAHLNKTQALRYTISCNCLLLYVSLVVCLWKITYTEIYQAAFLYIKQLNVK